MTGVTATAGGPDAPDDGLPLSRRAALVLLGAGGAAAATGRAAATVERLRREAETD